MSSVQQGDVVGGFRVGELIGEGAMARVYRAEDSTTSRTVALKVLEVDDSTPPAQRNELVQRFEAEARIATQLEHPNLVKVHGAGNDGERLFIAMELVAGDTLDDLLRTGRILAPEEIADLAGEIGAALDHAHSRGVVHRDVKPGNVLLTAMGAAKVVDFGVAREAASTLTATGVRVGTPAYMAPEQVRGQAVTPASDQFALAALTYRMLTGKLPFRGGRPTDVMFAIVNEQPEPPSASNVRLDRRVDEVLLRGLAKEPADRFTSCSELVGELRRALSLEADAPNPPGAASAPSATTTVSGAKADDLRRQIEEQAARRRGDADTLPVWRRPVVLAVGGGLILLLLLWAALT